MKVGPTVTQIASLQELRVQTRRIHPDGMFSNGIISVALGLFPAAAEESGQVGPSCEKRGLGCSNHAGKKNS